MEKKTRNRARRSENRRGSGGEDAAWIWGVHAALAALQNPQRKVLEIHLTRNAASGEFADYAERAKIIDPKALSALLPPGAVHQGVALKTKQPDGVSIEDLVAPAKGLLVMLDGVTDPRNAGAIYRSAAAFGAKGIIMQARRAPPLSGGLAKTAVGAAEMVPTARAVNLSRALGEFTKRGWRAIGLAGEAEASLAESFAGEEAMILVMGAEDKGLRPSVAEACDVVARIPMSGAVESLNVSTAASVAMYEWARSRL